MTWQIASQAVLACNRSGVIKQVEHRIIQEVDGYLIRMFPSQVENDWREIKVTDMVIELASSLALLVVFNDGIGKDPRLLQHLMSYSENLEGRVGTQMKYPFLLRPFVRRFSHSTRTLNSSIAALKGILVPEIRRRMEKIDQKQTSTTAGSEIFYLDSMIHLAYKKNIINSYSGEKEKNKLADLISEHTLMICFEFSGPIWMFAAIMLFEVMLRPKYVTPLREELEAAVELSKGEWSFDTFKHTPKLESFTRETLRVNPPSTLTSGRLVIEPLHLPSLGLTLEPGSKIALPSRWAMLDPDIYPDPHTFDGYRFIDPASGICDIRDTTTPSKTWLPFAIGTLTCPGRLIGLRVCQTILSKMLMDYDMELVNHDNHPLMLHGLGVAVPNPEIKMRVKSRHTGREKVQSAS
ncbi:cytochrome P450 [Penicillium lagena]|uniref:cytochrome P450 n=1 Tax=Penicillium lagena TaxID=94218 RepID=UPI002540BCE7|nr:cytochrome P450 [Penicillium lagena]KAJ5612590.1 cytochrome P450 [Penicillium lagena]